MLNVVTTDAVRPDDLVRMISAIVARTAERHQITHPIAPTDHLVDSGMSSMAMVDLMLAVEAEFDMTIPQREMTPLNFQSIEALAGMVRRVRGED